MSDSDIYSNIKSLWQNIQADNDGVLGGYGHLHEYEIQTSVNFLEGLVRNGHLKKGGYCLECCAGIGRVTIEVLQNYFDKIDLFDQEEKFIAKARDLLKNNDKTGEILLETLQNFEFSKQYDFIWSQWTIANLTNEDAEIFIKKCYEGLKNGGIVVVKENLCDNDSDYYQSPNSFFRSERLMIQLYSSAGFKPIMKQVISDWQDQVNPVAIIAFQKIA